MHRKLLTLFCVFLSLALFAQKKSGAQAVTMPEPPKIDYTQIGAPMPPLVLKILDTIDRTVVRDGNWWFRLWHKRTVVEKTSELKNEDFKSDVNLFVMLFNPNCGHCIEQTEVFKKNMDLFHKSRLVMVANVKMKDYLPDFIKQRETKNYPKITVGIDNSNFVNETFLYRALPQINVYSPERKLLKVYNGDIAIDSLKKYIQ